MEGKLIIVSAPSGSGKTTIVKHLIQQFPQLAFSVSATNRPKRTDEVDGKDYHFLNTEDFKKRIKSQEFIEWEEVYQDRFYGTLKSEVNKQWEKGKCVIFDVDVVGGNNLKKSYGSKALSLFIKPPSIDELKYRLSKRATEDETSFNARVSKAEEELRFEKYADEVIINDDLNKALNEAVDYVRNFLDI